MAKKRQNGDNTTRSNKKKVQQKDNMATRKQNSIKDRTATKQSRKTQQQKDKTKAEKQ